MRGRHRVRSGDEDYSAYVEASWPRLFRTAHALTGDRHEAEDLLQASLAKTFVSWRRVRDKGAADAYVRRVMVNTAASRWRSGRHEQATDVVPDAGHDGGVESATTQVVLWQRISELPPRMRATLVLRYYEDLTEAETAREMGLDWWSHDPFFSGRTPEALEREQDDGEVRALRERLAQLEDVVRRAGLEGGDHAPERAPKHAPELTAEGDRHE